MPRGIVSKIYGAWYEVLPLSNKTEDGFPKISAPPIQARLRGKLRLQDKQGYRHLIGIGDFVFFLNDPKNPKHFLIEKLELRRNLVIRSNRKQSQILGSNLHRAILICSLDSPPPRSGLIDRFLASCLAGGVEPVILFTKIDLIDAHQEEPFLVRLYKSIGFSVYTASLIHPPLPKGFQRLLENGSSLLCGSSGTGKSTLLNLVLGEKLQATSRISTSTRKGRHTTTNSSLFWHPKKQGYLIDSPGIKEWGVAHLDRNQIYSTYPELRGALGNCRFSNCLHEKKSLGCAIQAHLQASKDAYASVLDNAILKTSLYLHPIRLKNMENMLRSLSDPGRIRTGDYRKETGRMRSKKLPPPSKGGT